MSRRTDHTQDLSDAPALRDLVRRPLRSEDFQAFNEHLAQLTTAGRPGYLV